MKAYGVCLKGGEGCFSVGYKHKDELLCLNKPNDMWHLMLAAVDHYCRLTEGIVRARNQQFLGHKMQAATKLAHAEQQVGLMERCASRLNMHMQAM